MNQWAVDVFHKMGKYIYIQLELHSSQGVKSISAEKMWICVKCRYTYQAEKAYQRCPICGAGDDMQGPLLETLQFEMLEEWKSEEH